MTGLARPPRSDDPRTPPGRQRATSQQKAVLQALRDNTNFRSAQQVHLDLNRDRGIRIGLTTVYRVLQTFNHRRIVELQRAEDGEVLYRLCTDSDHHHNLLCRRCGKAIGFTPHHLEQEAIRFATNHGFTDITHHIDLYGTCPQCAKS
jgi:Fur family ferric uptake transcriptional regulator